jgi:ribosomal protein L11 methylase PrmA
MPPDQKLASSFRDPSGFLFRRDHTLYRQINLSYQDDYEKLIGSGLYQTLVEENLLIPHEVCEEHGSAAGTTSRDTIAAEPVRAYKIIRPEPIPFISYPYEWSFSQLKDAALATLAIQKRALEFDMSLKDASAYNIQFYRGRPILIDTLSFETYREGKPWVAYRQFCQHFLAPLALMAHKDVRLNQLLRVHIDGVPLDLASQLLPLRTRLSFPLLTHLHLHAGAQKRYAHKPIDKEAQKRQLSRTSLIGITDSLESGIRKLGWQPRGTEWADYYTDTNYTEAASQHKAQLIQRFLEQVQPQTVWDFGANTGQYSRLASNRGIPTLAFDVDAGAVERNYLDCVANGETDLLPLVMDLTNPSPGIGWHHRERMSLLNRALADLVMALALVHHLAIGNNVPLAQLAHFFAETGRWLIIEFVPKSDSQVQRLLATREDIFPDYTDTGFVRAFSTCYDIQDTKPIEESRRVLYLMKRAD